MRLGDLARYQNGFAFKPVDWVEEGVPIIRIQNLTESARNFNRTQKDVPERFRVESGDLLYSWSGTLGAFIWNGEPGYLNQHIFKVTPGAGVDRDFLYFILKHVTEVLQSKTHGSTMRHVTKGDFDAVPVRLPTREEQQNIVDLLSRAAGLKRLAEQVQVKGRHLVPALFASIFGDPATNPKGWPVVALGDCFAVKGGKRLPTGHDYARDETTHPYIRGTDIHAGHIVDDGLRFIDEATHAAISRYVVGDGDVVITIAGKIGVAAPVPADLVGANLTENAAMIRCLPGVEAVPSFVAAQINSPVVQRQIEALTGRVTVAKLALERIKTLRLFLPGKDVQSEFAERLDAVRSILRLAEGAASLAERTTVSLMSRLLDS